MIESTEDKAIERARAIIAKVGGVDEVCRITGRSRTRVYSWTYRREKHGTGGMIPPACQIALVDHARASGLPLTPNDFFPPNTEDAALSAASQGDAPAGGSLASEGTT
ncbi:helix-turn-helix domain-containing protein [uncultured Mameliella sp.]|uniref:helix-turn-helix domain-containing protein n=1 Tax=uncultured Mameliella sp. TaxID=1447087 RepID=UPI0026394B7C|nr:helix-turn-helix domain-containing protein [uncultured Mameliella sp.]